MATPRDFQPGQRWISEAEPELGLGFLVLSEFGRIEILFPAAEERRTYALAGAPIRRVRFAEGDVVQTRDAQTRVVTAVREADGLLTYETDKGPLAEAELSETISYSKPEDRLLGGQSDAPGSFDLRYQALEQLSRWRSSPLRGFIGPRMDLIPHQIAIASDVCARLQPRVLLSDEVGLGKTIEACLIVHRLILTGRIARVLIVVPDALVHQWFVELLRRFNFSFRICDEEHFEDLRARNPEGNPFLDDQLVLIGRDYLIGTAEVQAAAVAAGWDLLVVDEAHHLGWTPEAASPAYACVEALARVVPGVLLLTATPQQLGLSGHFARLRLLEPERYPDLGLFAAEIESYNAIARWVEKMETIEPGEYLLEELPDWGKEEDSWQRYAATWAVGEKRTANRVLEEVVEHLGPGRVVFRNTRARLQGFPGRKVHMVPLDVDADADPFTARIEWLVKLLKKRKADKILLICKSPEEAGRIVDDLATRIHAAVTLFHEGLSLLQRDRCAAYFAEEDGAQLMVCSEIGSEGRNFQFAHHLVLWDLPEEPDVLEQRIGRLDRIGQRAQIHIHVPYLRGRLESAWARWYADGLGALAAHVPGAHLLGEAFIPRLRGLTEPVDEEELQALLADTRAARQSMVERLRTGRDRLLAVGAIQHEAVAKLIAGIEAVDADPALETFLVDLLEEIGVQVNEEGGHTYRMEPVRLKVGALPFLPQTGLVGTFSRAEALAREDRPFLTIDHPMIENAMEAFLSESTGNAVCAVWPSMEGEGIFLEALFVAECVASPALHMDRFFPPTPIRKLLDHTGKDCSEEFVVPLNELQPLAPQILLDRRVVRTKLLPSMLQAARKSADVALSALRVNATVAICKDMDAEIHRLQFLSSLNHLVQPEEAEALIKQKEQLLQATQNAHVRMDAIRLIWRKTG